MKKMNHSSSRKIRIIGGKWRGWKLPVLNSPGLRPTISRSRETLFNWLSSSIVDTRCLDCFAGSGALGIEALSRYAASVTLLEMKCHVAQQLKKNLMILKADNANVVNTDTLYFLTQPGIAHNIAFVDPPFRKNLIEKTLFLLERNGWLEEGALIYVESEAEKNLQLVPSCWGLYRKKVAGQTAYRLYYRNIYEKFDTIID